jgi:hypothetical protein
MKAFILGILLVGVSAGRALAYPQFQLSKDQTCSACHISPSGEGLLNENGRTVSETSSMWGTDPAFMYGKVALPSWLAAGGDFRGAWGYLQTPQKYLAVFPMQADLYAAPHYDAFTLYLEGGYRPSQYVDGVAQQRPPWSREHWLMWQSDPGSPNGLFVRAGRFMPVFGLRFAEHVVYTRRFGGTPLYGETYGAAAEYITPDYEGHLTAFIKDPLIDSVEHANGAAAYGELRLDRRASIGAEGMFQATDVDKKLRAGVTGKLFVPAADVLLQGELQFVNQRINGGGAPNQLVGYVMGSWFPIDPVMIDLGLGYYNENLRIKNLDRDAIDLNVHFFAISHFEALINARIEFIGFGAGAPTGGYALLMGHYRL